MYSVELRGRELERIKKMASKIRRSGFIFCIEKARMITDAYKATEGEPEILRQAKAFARVLDNLPIWIDEDETIVGHGSSKPWGIDPDLFHSVLKEEDIRELEKQGSIIVDERDWPQIKEVFDYWRTKSVEYRVGHVYSEEEFKFMQTGVWLPPTTNRHIQGGAFAGNGLGLYQGFHLNVPDYPRVLNYGLLDVIREAQSELEKLKLFTRDDIEKKCFLEAVIISLNAIIRLAHRYAKLAEEMASKENDPLRKKELERIAETCRWVPANPARTFYEAIQSFWFIYLVVNLTSMGMGRFDQYMYPFYKRDKDSGRITDEEVLALLCELRIKDMELVRIALRSEKRKQRAGDFQAKWHNMIIGGVTPDGRDATNELTYLVLEAAKIVRTPHHTITLRVHENTPEDLMIKALEVVKLGIGMPAFIGDKSYIDFLVSLGVPLEAARDYAVGGCLDTIVPGKSRIIAVPFFTNAKILDIFLNNGIDPNTGIKIGPFDVKVEDFSSFDELFKAFKKYLAYFIEMAIQCNNTWGAFAEMREYIIEAALSDGGLKDGKGLFRRKMPVNYAASLLAVGMINVADSLAAIKKLVFDDKKITLKQLKEALAANWQGYEEIRKMCLEAPKYGNDDDYVDSIAVDLYNFYADEVYKYSYTNGERWVPGGISISSMWAGGAITGATPDGRLAGEVLADGSMSPMRGRDVNGPTAVIKSASKIPQSRFASTLMNMKFHPSALSSTEDLRKLAFLIKTYFNLGGKHVQFNVVSKETLIDAQKHPENYRDLIVRVAGYSAYFVELAKPVQDEVIARTELSLAS